MQNVRLIDITSDFYAFSHNINNYTEIIISAHGFQNQIKRNGEFIDAFQLAELIKSWDVPCSRIIVACCFSVYLRPEELITRLSYGFTALSIYKSTLACMLSDYIHGVSIVGFIGEVTSSVDNPQAWDLYETIDPEFGRGLLERTLSATFTIRFNAAVTVGINNPCRYIEFFNGGVCQQYGPEVNINNRILTAL